MMTRAGKICALGICLLLLLIGYLFTPEYRFVSFVTAVDERYAVKSVCVRVNGATEALFDVLTFSCVAYAPYIEIWDLRRQEPIYRLAVGFAKDDLELAKTFIQSATFNPSERKLTLSIRTFSQVKKVEEFVLLPEDMRDR